MRGKPSVLTGIDFANIFQTPFSRGGNDRTHAWNANQMVLHATHRDTPPEDFTMSWQVYWLGGSLPLSVFPMPFGTSDTDDIGSPLTVAGAAPDLAVSTALPDSLLVPDN